MDNENEKEEVVRRSGDGFLKGLLTGILFCSLIALIVFLVVGDDIIKKQKSDKTSGDGSYLAQATSTDAVTLEDIDKKLQSMDKIVDQYYYYSDDVDMNVVADDIYKAYAEGLDDKYTVYYTKEEMDSMMEQLSGSYCGIGAVVSQYETGEVVILLPYEGSPASEAGLQPGDIVLSIDGTELTGMELDKAVTIVKGEEGTSADFKVRRNEEEFDVTIERRKIDIQTVSSEMKDGNVGYISITSFEQSTVKQFKEAIDELLAQGAEGLVFDLRDNGGGMLDSVVDMLDYLLPKELVLYMEDKYGNRENYFSEEGCIDESIPMAVIINGNSASASEVFTGALQDYGRAKIFGIKSYGKGVVQNLIPLADGSGIKLTIASYFTPKGRNFNNNGIDPDETVELDLSDEAYDAQGFLKEEYDTQMNKALDYIRSLSR